jgi:hypothetical protein
MNKKISELNPKDELAKLDMFPIYDSETIETKKVSLKDLHRKKITTRTSNTNYTVLSSDGYSYVRFGQTNYIAVFFNASSMSIGETFETEDTGLGVHSINFHVSCTFNDIGDLTSLGAGTGYKITKTGATSFNIERINKKLISDIHLLTESLTELLSAKQDTDQAPYSAVTTDGGDTFTIDLENNILFGNATEPAIFAIELSTTTDFNNVSIDSTIQFLNCLDVDGDDLPAKPFLNANRQTILPSDIEMFKTFICIYDNGEFSVTDPAILVQGLQSALPVPNQSDIIPVYNLTYSGTGTLYDATISGISTINDFPDLFHIYMTNTTPTSGQSTIGIRVNGGTIYSLDRVQNGVASYKQQLEPNTNWLCMRGSGRLCMINNATVSFDPTDFNIVGGVVELAGLSSSYTFSNGITETSGAVKLGGELTGNTTINSTTNKNLNLGEQDFELGTFIVKALNGITKSVRKVISGFVYTVTDVATHTLRDNKVTKTNDTTSDYDESRLYQTKDLASITATKTTSSLANNTNAGVSVSDTTITKSVGTQAGTTYTETTTATETEINAPTGKGLKVTSATQSNLTWATDDDYVPTIGKIKANIVADPKLDTQDIWQETILQSNNLNFVTGGAITSGTIAGSTFGGWGNGVVFRSTASANTGYRIHLENFIYLGVTDKKFKLQYRINSSIIKLTMGFFNTLSATTASTNAVKFEVLNMVGTLTTTDTSTSSVNVTTYTHTVNTIYTLIMEINSAGTSANVKVYDGTNSTPVLDITNTTNIPTGSSKTMYVGAKGTYNGTPAGITDLCEIGRFGIGDITGYLRDKGRN